MEELGRQVRVPSVARIVRVNQDAIRLYGGQYVGVDNLRSRESLENTLFLIGNEIFGADQFPTLLEKAAALGECIIARHVFWDGNKRTGVYATWMFLKANGVIVNLDSSVEDLAVSIASGAAGFAELLDWLHQHQYE